MTLDKLLNCSSAEWEQYTEAELKTFFAAYHHITKPDLNKPKEAREMISKSVTVDPIKESKKKKAMALAAAMGLDLKL